MNEYYVLKDTEYNLARMFKDTIIKAIVKHPTETYGQIAVRLGISERTLYRHMKNYGIKKENKKSTYLTFKNV